MPKFTFSFSWGLYLEVGGVSQQEGTGCSPKRLWAGAALPSPPVPNRESRGQSHSPEWVLGLLTTQGCVGLKGEMGREDRAEGERQHLRASPKSMIFTMCPVAVTQRMFSGCRDRETIDLLPRGDIARVRVWQLKGQDRGSLT